MPDNLAVTPGSGATIATDEVTWPPGGGTVHVPLGKLIIGANNEVETISRGQQTMTNSLPVAIASDQSAVRARGAEAVGATLSTDPVIIAAQVRTSRRNGASNNTVQTLTLDDLGNLVIRDTAYASDIWSYSAAVTSTTTQNVKALASGLRQWITGMQFTNDSGSSLRVTVQDTSATVLWRGLVPTGGGIVVPLPKPLMTASGVGVDLVLGSTPGGTVPSGGTAAVLCNLQGYQGV